MSFRRDGHNISGFHTREDFGLVVRNFTNLDLCLFKRVASNQTNLIHAIRILKRFLWYSQHLVHFGGRNTRLHEETGLQKPVGVFKQRLDLESSTLWIDGGIDTLQLS